MNEIDPASNGSITTVDQESTTSSNLTSPLLSSLLSNGQQNNVRTTSTMSNHTHGLMSNSTNDIKSPSNAFSTNSRRSDDQNIINQQKYSSLTDLLQKNNNNNKSQSDDSPPLLQPPSSKSILENCLLKPSSLKPGSNQTLSQSESQLMEHQPTTSSVLKLAPTSEDNRKVEPIKINLNREPIRTVIKIPTTSHYDCSTSPSANKPSTNDFAVSPTLSSSSHSSESSFDNFVNSNDRSSIQVIPKLHIRNIIESSLMNHEQSEPHIVPKITITGLSSPQHDQQIKDNTANSLEISQSSQAIPKLTIKKDNNDYHLNNDNTNSRHLIKNHHHHQKDIDKAKPPIPKMMVAKIKEPQETIPKLTLKQVNNSSATSPTFEKVVPKILVKFSKEPEEIESSSGSPTPSPPPVVPKLNIRPIPPPQQPIEKEVIRSAKNCADLHSLPPSDMKFTVNRLLDSNDKEIPEPLEINTTQAVYKNSDPGLDSPRIILKINKMNNESITTEIVPQLTSGYVQKVNHKRSHINDNSSEVDMVKRQKLDETLENLNFNRNIEPSLSDVVQKNHKNMTQDQDQLESTVSDMKSSRSLRQRKNHESKSIPVPTVSTDADSNNSKENSQPEFDPLSLSNDATLNTNSIDELTTPTPKRGRGRPKKAVLEKISVVNEDPLDISQSQNNASQNAHSPITAQVDELNINNEDGLNVKKSSLRGRGRGRGRVKRIVEVVKNGKPVTITLEGHDDDDSPSFSLYNRSQRGGSTGKKSRNLRGRGRGRASSSFSTPERSKDGIFTTPDFSSRKKLINTPSLFEEDTRMSIGGGDSSQMPLKSSELLSNEESQSSQLSSTSNTIEGSATKKRSKKMEVCEPEGRIEFTIDMLSEYDWPQNEPPKNRETYMVQEQIAEYLGVKSFKRKYPDLHRRTVDMEERNYLFESGLASEKMCDLGLTAVYSSEVLDIMCNDYPEKYEEYKRYQREKAFQYARQRLETAVIDRSQMQKDKSVSSASDWNSQFNRDRIENRRSCMDLQNFLIQKPSAIRNYNTTPSIKHLSHYPVSVVPGQYSEYYEKLNSLQLACYPLNTILVEKDKLEKFVTANNNVLESSDDSDESYSEDENVSSNSETSDSESSTDDDYEDPKCLVCTRTPFLNQYDKPEQFVKCSKCRNQAHPSCIEMSSRMFQRILAYSWQCSDCKTCCKCKKAKDNKMLYCVQCDRGFHIYCLGLRNIPEGQYHCDNCNICSECGSKSAEGHFNPSLTQQQRQDLAMIAQWNHEFTINPLTKIREHISSFCLPCFRKNKKESRVEILS